MPVFEIQRPQDTIIPLDTIKQHARIDANDDDQLLTDYTILAEHYIATHTKVVVSPTDVVISQSNTNNGSIVVPFNPIISVLRIEKNGTAINANSYNLEGGKIHLNDVSGNDKIQIVLKCGHRDVLALPANIKIAVLLLVTHLYQNRGEEQPLIARQVREILAPLHTIKF